MVEKMSVFRLENLSYTYDKKKYVLQNCNYEFEKGKVYAILGKSGAGKTTLLSLLSKITKPTSGSIFYEEKNVSTMNQYEYRSKYVGVIFQSYNLLQHLNALENVQLGMDISGKKIANKKEVAVQMLHEVGLHDELMKRRVLKLSGGEQQRVAIARTLSSSPDVILADEPTGNLDGATQDEIMKIFKNLAHKQDKCIIIVTHSQAVAKQADVCFELKNVQKKTNIEGA